MSNHCRHRGWLCRAERFSEWTCGGRVANLRWRIDRVVKCKEAIQFHTFVSWDHMAEIAVKHTKKVIRSTSKAGSNTHPRGEELGARRVRGRLQRRPIHRFLRNKYAVAETVREVSPDDTLS